jgi:nucleotide-binding universal stress UspA family protein
MGGTVVCGITETLAGRGAADLAHALGARLGLRVVLVHVVEEGGLNSRQLLDEIAFEFGEGTETRILLGNPADALAEVAADEGADLIVIGSHPAGFGSRRLRCALARELEAATHIPVVMAPPATRKRSDHRLAVAMSAATG